MTTADKFNLITEDFRPFVQRQRSRPCRLLKLKKKRRDK